MPFQKGHKICGMKGKKHSEKTKRKMSLIKLGEKHPNWKGDNAGYVPLHRWLCDNHKKKNKCDFCRRKKDGIKIKRTELAIKKGKKYSRNRNDYFELCKSCHIKYDMTLETRLKMSKAKRNMTSETKLKMSKAKKGQIPWIKGKRKINGKFVQIY